ncbi:MAG: cytochrome b/b6 domain-containing protein [Candidatus Puniceispirillales bacterium]
MAEKQKHHGGVVWDLPVRLFHWLLAVSVIVSIASVKNENMFIHEKSGLTIIGLLVFRIIWGMAGSPHARFARFLVSPQAVLGYIRQRLDGDRRYHPGHAPTGGYATMVILLVLLVMAGLGLMANDDVLYEGPLALWAGDFSATASRWHHLIEKLVFAIIVLHLAAIGFYRLVLDQKLIPPMITGGHDPAVAKTGLPKQLAGLLLLAGCVVIAQVLGYDANRFY